jgi:hypothetical protein
MKHYKVPATSVGSPGQTLQPLSFNDAPVDLISSYFTDGDDNLENVTKLLQVQKWGHVPFGRFLTTVHNFVADHS